MLNKEVKIQELMEVVDTRTGDLAEVASKDSKRKTVTVVYADGTSKVMTFATFRKYFEMVITRIETPEEEFAPVVDEPEKKELAPVAEESSVIDEAPKAKKTRRKSAPTWDEMVADIPLVSNIQLLHCGGSGKYKYPGVVVKRGHRRIFKYTGDKLVVLNAKLVEGLEYTMCGSQRYIVKPTRENMLALMERA